MHNSLVRDIAGSFLSDRSQVHPGKVQGNKFCIVCKVVTLMCRITSVLMSVSRVHGVAVKWTAGVGMSSVSFRLILHWT